MIWNMHIRCVGMLGDVERIVFFIVLPNNLIRKVKAQCDYFLVICILLVIRNQHNGHQYAAELK